MGQDHAVSQEEKRRHTRISTENSVKYVLYDENKKKIDNGKGLALNLSQSGVLLETEKALSGKYILLITIDLEGTTVKVKGKVLRSELEAGVYRTGVKFIGSRDEQQKAIVTFVKSYLHMKHQPKEQGSG